MMEKFNKEEFQKTVVCDEIRCVIVSLERALVKRSNTPAYCDAYLEADRDVEKYLMCWNILKKVIQQFYGIEYHFTRTDEYYGVCTEDESDYLFKVNRKY